MTEISDVLPISTPTLTRMMTVHLPTMHLADNFFSSPEMCIGQGFWVFSVFFFLTLIWKIEKTTFTFVPVLLVHLSRKAEGHGPMKP